MQRFEELTQRAVRPLDRRSKNSQRRQMWESHGRGREGLVPKGIAYPDARKYRWLAPRLPAVAGHQGQKQIGSLQRRRECSFSRYTIAEWLYRLLSQTGEASAIPRDLAMRWLPPITVPPSRRLQHVPQRRNKSVMASIPLHQNSTSVTQFREALERQAKGNPELAHKLRTLQVNAIEANDEEGEFGPGRLGFPTSRRPTRFRRELAKASNSEVQAWTHEYPKLIGELAVTKEEREQAARLLYTWRDLFVNDVRLMPVTDLVEHRIPTYSNVIPRVAKPKRYTPEEVRWQRQNIPALIEAGVITQSESPWSARTRFVHRKDGGLRMTQCFIPINDATIKSNYPMRRIEPILNDISKDYVRVMFQADAANGYWAIPMYPNHAYKTSFSCTLGQFCYLRMGQGLTGGPASYSRLKDLVTGSIPAPNPEPALSDVDPDRTIFHHFLDDDVGGSETFQSLFWFLQEHYFPRLAWSRLTLNPKKSRFFVEKVNILGHTKTAQGIRPSADKLGKFREWPSPTDEKELLQFVYMLPFLRAFVPGRADLVTVMKQAVVQETKTAIERGRKRTIRTVTGFNWGPTQQQAFEAAKAAVLSNTTTGGDDSLQYHLATDASQTGIGGVLFQLWDTPPGTWTSEKLRDRERIVMFLSFQLSKTEQRYHTTEREALAVLKCLEECRWLVKGSPFTVKLYTDHEALKKCLCSEDGHGRLVRWQLRLQEYDLDIKHVPGRELAVADGLSRIRGHPSEEGNEDFSMPALITEVTESYPVTASNDNEDEWVNEWQEWAEDPWYAGIVEYKLKGTVDGLAPQSDSNPGKAHQYMANKARRYQLIFANRNQLGYRERSGAYSQCLHPGQVTEALQNLHDAHGHFSERITLQHAIGRFFWPTRARDIFEYCRSCANCQMIGPLRPTQGLLPILQLQPFDLIGIDYIGPFTPIAQSGARFILIAVDYFSRFLIAKAVPTARSANTLEFFQRCITDVFGYPRAVYSDNGSHFTGGVFPLHLKEMGVKQVLAPISHPSSVGLAERYVQVTLVGLRAILQKAPELIFDWDATLPTVVNAANTRTIRVHGYTPSQLLFGFQVRYLRGNETYEDELRGEGVALNAAEWIEEGHTIEEVAYHSRLARLDELRDTALTRLSKSQAETETNTMKNGKSPEVGDLILLRRLAQDNQRGHKLEPRWEGPYKLVRRTEHGKSGWIEDLHSGTRIGKYHLNDMKVFVERREHEHPTTSWKSIATINQDVKGRLKQYQRERARTKQERQRRGEPTESDEEEDPALMDLPDIDWWGQPFRPAKGLGDEGFDWWGKKSVNLQTDLGLDP